MTIIRGGGRPDFVAPELSSGVIYRSTESGDIFSFAMTMYVLGTGKSNPFDGLKNLDMKWDQLARCGRRPPCPERFCGMDNVSTKLLYDLLSNMWGADPQARPTADFVKSKLLSIATTLDSKFSEPVAPQQPIDFQPLLLFTLSIDK